jgi:hypothetical protein
MNARIATVTLAALIAPAALLAACGTIEELSPTSTNADASLPTADGGGADATPDATVDASTSADAAAPDAAAPGRTMVERPLFGDALPQNLFLDPNFAVRQGGLGNWMAVSADPSNPTATLSASLMSDSPNGVALPVGRLSDAKNSKKGYGLTLVAQVPGGPGPFRLRVWLSTVDPAASVAPAGVTFGLLTSLNGKVVEIEEAAGQAKVFTTATADGGVARTWHLYEGTIDAAIQLGAFVVLDVHSSANTWLLQAPELVPLALVPEAAKGAPRAAKVPRDATEREREAIRWVKKQPVISVPAAHAAVSERAADLR